MTYLLVVSLIIIRIIKPTTLWSEILSFASKKNLRFTSKPFANKKSFSSEAIIKTSFLLRVACPLLCYKKS